MILFLKKNKGMAVVGAGLLLVVGYFGVKALTKTAAETRYVLGVIHKGTLVTSVSGSGQVSSLNQVDVKARASGDITNVRVKDGQVVKAGAILAEINAADAYKAVRDAEANVRNAELSLEKIKTPASEYSLIQAQNDLENARTNVEKLVVSQPIDYQKALETKRRAEDGIEKGYADAFSGISNTFLDLPSLMADLYNIIFSNDIGKSEPSIGSALTNDAALANTLDVNVDEQSKIVRLIDEIKNTYNASKIEYNSNFDQFKNANRSSNANTIDGLLVQTIATTKNAANAVKKENDILTFWVDNRTIHKQTIFAKVTAYQTLLNSYTAKLNSDLSNLLAIQSNLKDNKQTVLNAVRDIETMDRNNPLDLAAAKAVVRAKEASLANIQNGAEPLDIKAQELALLQRKNALLDAREKLADYFVRAPFDGVVAKIVAKKGDSFSQNGVVATLVTPQQTAQISLNEVDVAKIKIGEKATLTFDAIEGLSLTGVVAEIDTIGTVSQGVVTYSVKIVFDTQDDRVKSGMSVSAAIITNVVQDTLLAPSSAIKSQGSTQYVEMFDQPLPMSTGAQGSPSAVPPRQQIVEIGLSNDTMTEIRAGLKENDEIVVRTILPTTNKTTATQAPSLLGGNGRGGILGGGGTRPATGGR